MQLRIVYQINTFYAWPTIRILIGNQSGTILIPVVGNVQTYSNIKYLDF